MRARGPASTPTWKFPQCPTSPVQHSSTVAPLIDSPPVAYYCISAVHKSRGHPCVASGGRQLTGLARALRVRRSWRGEGAPPPLRAALPCCAASPASGQRRGFGALGHPTGVDCAGRDAAQAMCHAITVVVVDICVSFNQQERLHAEARVG